jgi:hypothetical protein
MKTSAMHKARHHARENLAWAREHLSRWHAAGSPTPDGLTQVAMRTLERHAEATEAQPALFLEVAANAE